MSGKGKKGGKFVMQTNMGCWSHQMSPLVIIVLPDITQRENYDQTLTVHFSLSFFHFGGKMNKKGSKVERRAERNIYSD